LALHKLIKNRLVAKLKEIKVEKVEPEQYSPSGIQNFQLAAADLHVPWQEQ
jgi:hypothetical protein